MIDISAAFVPHSLLRAVAPLHGEILNISLLCRSLVTTRRRTRGFLNRLIRQRWIRVLEPLPHPRPAEIILSKRVFLSAKAWGYLLGQPPEEHPQGYQRRILVDLLAPSTIDQIVEREYYSRCPSRARSRSTVRLYSMRCYRERGVDLVIDRGDRRIGINFEPWGGGRTYSVARAGLADAKQKGFIDRAFLLTCEAGAGIAPGGVFVLPATLFLAHYWVWTGYLRAETPKALLELYQSRIVTCHGFWYPTQSLESSLTSTNPLFLEGKTLEHARRMVRRMGQLLARPP